jgi:hypothetical protein
VRFADALMDDLSRQRVARGEEADFAYSLAGVGRFRVAVFHQRGSIGIVLRRVLPGAQSFTVNVPAALAIASRERHPLAPEVPTVAETIPGFEVLSINGIVVAGRTPPELVKRLNAEYNKIISDPEMRKRMIANGYEPVGGPPERFGVHIRAAKPLKEHFQVSEQSRTAGPELTGSACPPTAGR